MKINVDRSGTIAGFENILDKMLQDNGAKGLLILACDANNFTPGDLDETLKNAPLPLLGGVFPEIIYGKEKLTKGTIIAGLPKRPNVQIIPNLSDIAAEYDDIIDEKIPDLEDAKTMLVMVDGLATRVAALVDGLFDVFGLEVNYIGGGAGSLSFEQKPCLFSNDGLLQNSALLALLDMQSGIGVNHGWSRISGPFQVTEVDKNVIRTLNWRPAFEIYREVVEEVSGQVFGDGNFFDIAKGYPFGVNKMGSEKIVRDPIAATEEGALVCVGEVPAGSYVDILSGDVNSLVNAAGSALARGKQTFAGQSPDRTILFIDCISRVLFLEDHFKQELDMVFDENTPLLGALTLGEIASNGRDYLEFYNKTAVVGVLEG